MCGRFHLNTAPRQVLAHYGLSASATDTDTEAMPTGEVFPGTRPFVVTQENDTFELQSMFWGFRPFRAQGRRKQPINARAENLFASNYWRPAAQAHRCLIPLNSWDEWQQQPGRAKQRWRLAPRIDSELFSLGGVFTTYKDDDGTRQTGFAIITQPASSALETIHHRQPLIVMPEGYGAWLDPTSTRADVERTIRRQGRNYVAQRV